MNSIKHFKEKSEPKKRNIKKSFVAACDQAHLVDLQFRDLRRTANVRILACGASPVFAQKILGHASPTINYEHYTTITPEIAKTIALSLAEQTHLT